MTKGGRAPGDVSEPAVAYLASGPDRFLLADRIADSGRGSASVGEQSVEAFERRR